MPHIAWRKVVQRDAREIVTVGGVEVLSARGEDFADTVDDQTFVVVLDAGKHVLWLRSTNRVLAATAILIGRGPLAVQSLWYRESRVPGAAHSPPLCVMCVIPVADWVFGKGRCEGRASRPTVHL